MAGRFYNPCRTTLVVILLTVVVINRIDGYPYQWPGFFSNDQEMPGGKESLKDAGIVTEDNFRGTSAVETAAADTRIHFLESSLAYADRRDESQVVEISEQKRTTGYRHGMESNGEEDANKNGDEHHNHDDDNNNNDEDQSEDEITRLIEQAFQNDELVGPEEWAKATGNGENTQDSTSNIFSSPIDLYGGDEMDSNTSFKNQKTRSSGDQHRIRYEQRQGVVTPTIRETTDGKIVFPDDEPMGKPQSFTPGPVPTCDNTTFCEDIPYYPSDYVDVVLRMNENLKYLATVDVPSMISQRIDASDEDDALCVSKEDVVRPKTALSKDDQWLYIVNNQKFMQAVRVEICKSHNSVCSIIDGFAEGYKTTCKQKFIYRQLVAIASDGQVGPELFQIPASCCCHVKFTGNPLTRMGVSLGKSSPQSPVSKGRRE